jgi:signal transduction histidine kinase
MEQLFTALYAAGHKSFDLPTERLVALLRVALASFCLVTIATAPDLKPQIARPFELILATYALFGLGVALLPTIGRYRTGWQLPVHLIDVGIISILIYFVQALSTTFLILYVFVLLSATFRWNWLGALWTTSAILVVQVFLIWIHSGTIALFIIEWSFLFIVGGVFVLFGVSRERNVERLAHIAAWPSTKTQLSTEFDHHWLDASLLHVATVLEAPRVLVVWEILQEPYCFTVYFADGKCQQNRAMANAFGNLVAEKLDDITFATEAVASNECFTLNGTKLYVGPIVSETLKVQYNISSVCSAPFSGDLCKGRVFVLDRSDWGLDDLALAEIVAARLRMELEYYAIGIQLEVSAATRERARLARDLHDGVLQSLAAAGLQLASISSVSEQKTREKLDNVRKLLVAEQQRIRAFVGGRQSSVLPQQCNLHDEIKRKSEKLEHQWDCDVLLSDIPQDVTIPVELMRQIELLLAEATANAVQHGKASRINVAAGRVHDNVQLRIVDNGHGLKGDLAGTYSQSQLAAHGIGPRSIAKRVEELGGSFSLSSSSKGVELCIEVPCNERTARRTDEQAFALG